MPKSFREIADEVASALAPLPLGFYVKPDLEEDAVIVGSDVLCFALTRKVIEEGRHISIAKNTYPKLLCAIAQHHAMIAVKLDLATAKSVVEHYAAS